MLVVDDTPHNVKLLADLLGVKGYAVATAVNGEEALAKVASEAPDLILLDVMMPGLSGYDVCRRLRADPATALLPIVLVTSLDPQGERVKGIEAGADDFLPKPINQAELFARVRSLLRVKSLQDEVKRQAEALKEWNAEARGACRRAGGAARAAWPSSSASSRRPSPTRSSRPARSRSSPRTGARSATCSSTCAASPRSPIRPSRRKWSRCCATIHATMGALIAEYEGTLDRFAGDGILIFFNDPLPVPDAAQRAAGMALAMQEQFRPLRARWSKLGYELDLGIGIAQGFATLGAFGYEGRVDYSAIGSVVNLAARLCREAGPGEVLIDRRTRAALDDAANVESLGPLTLKGYAQPVPCSASAVPAGRPDLIRWTRRAAAAAAALCATTGLLTPRPSRHCFGCDHPQGKVSDKAARRRRARVRAFSRLREIARWLIRSGCRLRGLT